MLIVFASDHAGFELKKTLVAYVRDELGYQVQDAGTDMFDPEDDYPLYIRRASEKVARDPESIRGIILGGSGQGEAMQANRSFGVRAAVFYGGSLDIVRLSREHNDANILSLGARFLSPEEAKEAVKLWLATEKKTDEKYDRRNAMMDKAFI